MFSGHKIIFCVWKVTLTKINEKHVHKSNLWVYKCFELSCILKKIKIMVQIYSKQIYFILSNYGFLNQNISFRMNEKNDFLSLKLNNHFKDSPWMQFTL